MTITRETVKKVAHLARIEIKDDEETQFADELNKIVAWIEQLNEVNTCNVEPLDHAVSYSLRMREDSPESNNHASDILKNAQETVLDFFSVPKVVE
ncbi:MAG: Asp-tRNA(Asn)/Glu-tRNA(Gln) amidotransferase subunit GatC [Alphaproteobacteria bacterium]|nr:Asp-tRNA(Asn)/Glu-tRNA(Gln) amidotransferase subunit GatC [Alphaproteobacteria bacterium]